MIEVNNKKMMLSEWNVWLNRWCTKLAIKQATHVTVDVNGVNADFAGSTTLLSGACKHQICL